MSWLRPSVKVWFATLLLLNALDIATTLPIYEANPVTLLLWGRIGIFLAAWFKIGLVILFGTLCLIAKKVTNPREWELTSKVLKALLIILVAYYTFIVTVNLAITIFSIIR